jgi:hypothetical protein
MNPRPARAGKRLNWPPILDRAAEIIEETLASEGVRLTLRGLFYRLVSEALIPNLHARYKYLSSETAELRRLGRFPDLHESVRQIVVPDSWVSPQEALADLRDWYRRDRTEGQERTIILGVEKAAQRDYLSSWFDEFGLPVVAMAGYSSQTLMNKVLRYVEGHDRPAVVLYAGDFDSSGEDMDRDLGARLPGVELRRVALTPEQVQEFALPVMEGKATDSRAASFAARHGRLVQVELEALPPADLHRLYDEALAPVWDMSTFEASLAREQAERDEIGA